MKNKFFAVSEIFVLLLPSVTILLFLIFGGSPEKQDIAENTGVLRITEEESYFFGENVGENALLYDIFFDLEARSERSELSVSDITSEKQFEAELNKNGSITRLIFVPFLDGPCLWYGKDGIVYKLSEADSSIFINSEYSSSLYSHSHAPSLITDRSDLIYPESTEWHYTLKNGTFSSGITDRAISETVTYYCNTSTGFGFDLKPDICNVKAFADSVKIYDGSLEGLKGSEAESRTSVRYEVNATWSKTPESEYFGSASYNFIVTQTKPAEFYVDGIKGTSSGTPETISIQTGDFVLIKALNISNEKNIAFSSSKPIGFNPIFFKSGNTAYAFVPFSYDLDAGTYTLTLKYGDSSESFNVSVAKKAVKEQDDTSNAGELITSSSLAEVDRLINKIGGEYEKTLYANGTFLDYEKYKNNSFVIRLGFGNIRNYKNGKSVILNGVDFWASPAGENVPAINNGIVCAVGEDTLLGKYIVIDHGYGLKSWYCHLGSFNISVGDTVLTGGTIAQTGKTGLASSSGFYLITTIFDVPVSPYKLCEKNFSIK